MSKARCSTNAYALVSHQNDKIPNWPKVWDRRTALGQQHSKEQVQTTPKLPLVTPQTAREALPTASGLGERAGMMTWKLVWTKNPQNQEVLVKIRI